MYAVIQLYIFVYMYVHTSFSTDHRTSDCYANCKFLLRLVVWEVLMFFVFFFSIICIVILQSLYFWICICYILLLCHICRSIGNHIQNWLHQLLWRCARVYCIALPVHAVLVKRLDGWMVGYFIDNNRAATRMSKACNPWESILSPTPKQLVFVHWEKNPILTYSWV